MYKTNEERCEQWLNDELSKMTPNEIVEKIINDWTCPSCRRDCLGCAQVYNYTTQRQLYVNFLGSNELFETAMLIGKLKHKQVILEEKLEDCKSDIKIYETKLKSLL